MEAAGPYLWIFGYMDEIEADFIVFYRVIDIHDTPWLDGPRFLSLTDQLILYDGALRRKLTIEAEQKQQSGEVMSTANDSGFTPGQTMSMGEALAQSTGDEMALLGSLSRDGKNAGLGDLFEYETA